MLFSGKGWRELGKNLETGSHWLQVTWVRKDPCIVLPKLLCQSLTSFSGCTKSQGLAMKNKLSPLWCSSPSRSPWLFPCCCHLYLLSRWYVLWGRLWCLPATCPLQVRWALTMIQYGGKPWMVTAQMCSVIFFFLFHPFYFLLKLIHNAVLVSSV